MDTLHASMLLLGFLLIWSIIYWVAPRLVTHFRDDQQPNDDVPVRFLSETGTIHRLSREQPKK
ncbi:MAG: hypothetical protein ABIP64_07025 [Burkholderiales bacterium]